jgi:hypothetical protein
LPWGAALFEDLEDVADQLSGRVNERTPGHRGCAISPTTERVSVQRAPKPEAAATKAPAPAVAIPPPIASIARPVAGYRGLVETCRQRANELSMSRAEIDRLAGLPAGYSGKLLGQEGSALKPKRMWPQSLELILETLGLAIIIIENPAAAARTITRRVPVTAAQQRFGNTSNSPKQLAPPSVAPAETHAHLRVIQPKRRGSKYA